MHYIRTPQDTTPIEPRKINTSQPFWSEFKSQKAKSSARWIVRFCQEQNGGWQPLSKQKLVAFFREKQRDKQAIFFFDMLIPDGLVELKGDAVTLTREFVERCYAAAPA